MAIDLKNIRKPKKSWRTTTAAIATGVAAIATAIASFAAGEDVNWEMLAAAGMGLAAAFGLGFAKDDKKED